MFTRVTSPALTEPQLFAALHPPLAQWFRQRFAHFSPSQLHAVPEVLAGRSLLLTSPTGSGKTLAAFLSVFDWLARARDRAELPNGIVAVYVSPLRALAYDLRKNLEEPVRELGWDWLRIGARTGDTSPAERAAQRRKPPHIFVTTPESLTLMLSQPAWIAPFASTRFLIADELHALAENKRGAMLAVAAERLEEVIDRPVNDRRHAAPVSDRRSAGERAAAVADAGPASTSPATTEATAAPGDFEPVQPMSRLEQDPRTARALIRIGLSATVAPLETVAAFLVGPGRACRIAEARSANRPGSKSSRPCGSVLIRLLATPRRACWRS